MEEPLVVGKWSKKGSLFEEAGKKMEEIVVNIIENSEEPDAFTTIPVTVKTIGWEKFDRTSVSTQNTTTPKLAEGEIPRLIWRQSQ